MVILHGIENNWPSSSASHHAGSITPQSGLSFNVCSSWISDIKSRISLLLGVNLPLGPTGSYARSRHLKMRALTIYQYIFVSYATFYIENWFDHSFKYSLLPVWGHKDDWLLSWNKIMKILSKIMKMKMHFTWIIVRLLVLL